MQMNLFAVEEIVDSAKSPRRKAISRVMRAQVMLIDRPAPQPVRLVETKPEMIDPSDIIEEDIERWDGLY